MRRICVVWVVVVATVGALVAPPAGAERPAAAVGDVTRVVSFDPDVGELPEGVAVDKRGRIYTTMTFTGELRRLDRDGSSQVVAHLPTGNGFGPLGLAVDATGAVYAGVVTLDPATSGVYRVTPGGEVSRLPGTGQIGFANGVALGDGGTLYVTDSIAGMVWRIPKGGAAEPWVDSPLLDGDGSAPLPFPLGANGVTYRQGTVYVTNTERASIVAIPVLPNGDAGPPSVVIQHPALGAADGIALDVHGAFYVAVIAQSTIVRVSHDGSSLTTLAAVEDGLDYTSSLAFGSGVGERTTLFAVNFSVGPFFGDVRHSGPALLAVETGVPGLPQP